RRHTRSKRDWSSDVCSSDLTRDIIIEALVQTTSATADINLTADSDHDQVGGVWIQSTGKLDSGENVTVSGSNLFNPGAPNLLTRSEERRVGKECTSQR